MYITLNLCISNRMGLRAIWDKQPEVHFEVFQNCPNAVRAI